MVDSPATIETKRFFRSLALTMLGIAILIGSMATGILIIGVIGGAICLVLLFIGRAAIVEMFHNADDEVYLFPGETPRREDCRCCGCATLAESDDTCLLCAWPRDGSAPLPLEEARAHFRRYLTIYSPEIRPEWALPPNSDTLMVRQQLVRAYAIVKQDKSDTSAWLDVVELEGTLRSIEFNRASEEADPHAGPGGVHSA